MIKAIESGLPRSQYDKLVTGAIDGLNYAYQVIAHKANLELFEWLTNSTVVDNDDVDFSSIIVGSVIFRLSGATLEKYDLGTSSGWTAIAGYSAPSGSLITAPALVNTGAVIRVYAPTDTGLQVCESTDLSGATWGTWANFQGGTQTFYQLSSDLTDPTEAITAVTSSSVLSSDYDDAKAFNDSTTESFWAASTSTGWIRYQFPVAHAISAYTVKGRVSFLDQNPKSWTLQSSPDGTTWTTIHTVSNETGWTPGEKRTYIVTPPSSGLPAYTARTYWRLNFTANNGSTIIAVDEIEFIETVSLARPDYIRVAAASYDRIHMVYKNHQKQLYNLRCATWNGSAWTVRESDIWWTFDPGSFSVAALNGADFIVMATEVPGAAIDVSENNSPVKKLYTSGGIVCFKFQYNDWSDHYEIDLLDNVTDWRYRVNARIATINDQLIVTAYAGDGTEYYPFEFYRYYTSKNGKHWSMGMVFPLPDLDANSGFGIELIAYGDYIHALERKNSYRSLSVLPLGFSPSSQQLDITDAVLDHSLSTDGTTQAGMVLANDAGWLNDHSILNKNNTVWFEHKAGFYVPEKALITVAVTQMDSMEFQESIAGSDYDRTVRITSRDKWRDFADLVVSEQPNYLKSHYAGLDTFRDSSNTNYGGMAHTAIQIGSFKTASQKLEVVSNDEQAIAFSTLATNLWNGTHQVGFNLSTTAGATGMYAGVVFRAVDSKNYWYARYDQTTDKVILGCVQGGLTKTLLTPYQSSALTWTNFAIMRYIRVEFRYGLIRVFTSSDSSAGAGDGGRTWILAFEHKMDCSDRVYTNTLKLVSESPIELGYVGYIAKGKV